MDGILIIDKPAGITSHDVVNKVRRILNTRRVGHTGTLDPFATGVMVILVGQATRLAQFLDKDEKEYEAVMKFGVGTDTGDLTGTQNAEWRMQNNEIAEKLASTDWESVFDGFRGEILQTPPMFSAKKIDGKKLYEHARKGETIERKAVKVTIHKLEIVSETGAVESDVTTPIETVKVRVACSAGTYVRSLAEDIGRKVGTGAHLTELRRTRAGKFAIEQSKTLEQLEKLEDPATALIAMSEAVSHLPTFELTDDRIEKTKNGLSTRILDSKFKDGEIVSVTEPGGNVIAIGIYDEGEKSIQPKVVLV